MADETKNNQAPESVPSIPVANARRVADAESRGAGESKSPLRFLRGNSGNNSAGTAGAAGVGSSTASAANGTRGRRTSATAPSVAVPKARRMKLSLTKVDPWSVAKVSFLLSIAVGIIQIVAVGILWTLLSQIGLFDKLNTVISQTGLASNGMDVSSFLGFGQVISWVTIFAVFEVVLVVILATIGAFLYNVVSALVGGVHVTLGDD